LIARKGAFIEVCRRCYQTTIGCGCFAAFIGPDKEMLKYAEMGDLTNLILADSSFLKKGRAVLHKRPCLLITSCQVTQITTGTSISLNMTRSDR
jgi:hypothetical protein